MRIASFLASATKMGCPSVLASDARTTQWLRLVLSNGLAECGGQPNLMRVVEVPPMTAFGDFLPVAVP
jgi:hypothetical protein